MARREGTVVLDDDSHEEAAAPSLTVSLRPCAPTVRRARCLLEAFIDGDLDTADRDVAVLLTSELVTNAVVHAATPFTVRVHLRSDAVRVEVTDARSTAVDPVTRGPDAEGGRGLLLVEALASSWGTERHPHATTVWFELQLEG